MNTKYLADVLKDHRLLLGENHHPCGERRFIVEYVLVDNWFEHSSSRLEDTAKVVAAILLKQGKTVRISKTFECVEFGEPITPEMFAEAQKQKHKSEKLVT